MVSTMSPVEVRKEVERVGNQVNKCVSKSFMKDPWSTHGSGTVGVRSTIHGSKVSSRNELLRMCRLSFLSTRVHYVPLHVTSPFCVNTSRQT